MRGIRVFMFSIHVHADGIFRLLGVVWVGCVFLCLSHMSMLQEFSGSRVWYGGDAGDARFYICDICSWLEDFQAVGCGSGEMGRMQGCVFLFLSYMFMLR